MSLSPDELKLFERERADAAAPRSLAWYASQRGVRSLAEIATVLHHARLKPNHRVLEVGCGVGRIALSLAKSCAHVTATDLSPKSVEQLMIHAGERGLKNIQSECIDANSIDFHESFDRVVAVQVVQHIPSLELRRDAVHRMLKALKPEGKAIIVHYRWGGIIRDSKEGAHDDGRYRIAFTAEDLIDLLESVGFTRVRVTGCVNLPYRAYTMMRRWPALVTQVDVALSSSRVSRSWGQYLIGTGVRPKTLESPR
jgi:SAM-dependent methyltransferase